ncbi:MAG: hypothetical protein LAP87_15250 [Acidobacteriia bacterium]|nr:hypothetical protein [Terriglobia bacterium]
MRLLHLGIVFVLATAGFADTVTLKNGRVINGTYLGGSPRQIRVEVGDQIQTLDISDVARIEFGSSTSARADDGARPPLRRDRDSADDDARPVLRRQDNSDSGNVFRPDPANAPPPAATRGEVELPAGTNLVVRMIEGVDSETNRVGQTFAASLDEPVMIGGETVIPRGADVVVKLVDSKESGKFTGRSELTLDLVSVKVGGRMADINTQSVTRESSSRGERTAKVAGGTAAVGAIIGAIAGGGKGAAVGAAAGGAAGAGAEVVTKGQRVKIPSETRLTFVLDTAVRI